VALRFGDLRHFRPALSPSAGLCARNPISRGRALIRGPFHFSAAIALGRRSVRRRGAGLPIEPKKTVTQRPACDASRCRSCRCGFYRSLSNETEQTLRARNNRHHHGDGELREMIYLALLVLLAVLIFFASRIKVPKEFKDDEERWWWDIK
jgi:hypothetical protein